MSKANPFLPDMGPQALNAVMGDAWKRISGLNLPATTLAQLQQEYLHEATALWNRSVQPATDKAAMPAVADRRFAAKEWAESPTSAFTAPCGIAPAGSCDAIVTVRAAPTLAFATRRNTRPVFANESPPAAAAASAGARPARVIGCAARTAIGAPPWRSIEVWEGRASRWR